MSGDNALTPKSPHPILIVGASSGVGAALAERLVEPGVETNLILHGRSVERLDALATKLRKRAAGNVTTLAGDITDWAGIGLDEGVDKAAPELPPLGAVVWSAGICDLAPAGFLKEAALREMLEVNLMAPLLVLGNWFRRRTLVRGARVILIGSQAAHGAGAGFLAYAASKGGLSAAARVLSAEFARKEITVRCIEPGTLETPMTARLREAYSFDPAGASSASELATVVEEVIAALR